VQPPCNHEQPPCAAQPPCNHRATTCNRRATTCNRRATTCPLQQNVLTTQLHAASLCTRHPKGPPGPFPKGPPTPVHIFLSFMRGRLQKKTPCVPRTDASVNSQEGSSSSPPPARKPARKPPRKAAQAARKPARKAPRKPAQSAPGSTLSSGIKAIFARKRNRPNSVRVQLSAEECKAWRHRPYGCSSVSVAVDIYKAKLIFGNLGEDSFLRLREHRSIDSYPEWCFRHEHPVKTGRKRVLYHRSDVVGPIADAMEMFASRMGSDVFGLSNLLNKQRKRQRAEREQLPEARVVVAAGPASRIVYPFSCLECGNHDYSILKKTKEGMVCQCGAVSGPIVVAANRQKLGALQEDDKTLVADATRPSQSDRYDGPPKNSSETRASILKRAKSNSSGLGLSSRGGRPTAPTT